MGVTAWLHPADCAVDGSKKPLVSPSPLAYYSVRGWVFPVRRTMKNFTNKGEQSRQRILDAAIGLFAQKGFAGASVDEIVGAAHINKRMVYHYFGSKARLFQAALAHEYAKLEALETETLHPGEPIEKVMASIVHAYFSFLQANPEFVRLLLWENLNEGRNLEQMEIPLNKSPVLDLLVKAIDNGKRNGTIRREVDPRLLLVSLIGNCMVYFSNRHTLSRVLDLDLGSPAMLERAKKTVTDLLLHGVKA